MKTATLATALLLAVTPALAHEVGPHGKPPACATPESGLKAPYLGWGKSVAAKKTARTPDEAKALRLNLGQRVHFTLARAPITFLLKPGESMPKEYVFAGMASFDVPVDGVYAVVLSEANWIDVIQNGRLAESHGMGAFIPCTTMGKRIEYTLKKGEAVVQFSGAPYETVDLMIARLP
jgi:hypothetical protein